ncbi:MAG TPA: S-adenosylmethionine:tRNA ribosyltransferase-isomerase, partial [Blastocatellia bacterium]
MLVSDFDYELPSNLIAQEPALSRAGSRLLVVDRASGTFADSAFNRLPDFLRAGDVVVVNDTRVFPARLIGAAIYAKGGEGLSASRKVEVFLIRPIGPLLWEALVKPGRNLRTGTRVKFTADLSADALVCEIIQRLQDGRGIVRFEAAPDDLDSLVDKLGRTPLPPYIKRQSEAASDSERYQTV